ncbi:hypothetical protein EI94DRAFT_1788157, partial [Lactarius quietus]
MRRAFGERHDQGEGVLKTSRNSCCGRGYEEGEIKHWLCDDLGTCEPASSISVETRCGIQMGVPAAVPPRKNYSTYIEWGITNDKSMSRIHANRKNIHSTVSSSERVSVSTPSTRGRVVVVVVAVIPRVVLVPGRLGGDAVVMADIKPERWSAAVAALETNTQPKSQTSIYPSYKGLSQDMDEDPMPIRPADPTASRQPGSTQLAGYQGSQSSLVRVEVTVLRAINVPHIKNKFGGKREYFFTVTYQETTKKAKKTKKTKSVQIEGQMVVWNETLDAFSVQPSSHLILCIYAKRLTQRDLLIGTHEITIPTESESDISFVLTHGNGQAGRSTQPVMLNLTIIVPANRTYPSPHSSMPNEGDDAHAEEVPTPAVAPDPMGPDQSAEPEHPVQSLTPVSQGQGDVEKAQSGVVGRIKWVMDTLNPVSGLHPIVKMAYGVLAVIPQELSNQYQRDDKVRSLIKSMHNAFDFTRHEDTLKSIRPNSKQAEILTLMLRDVCGCSDFIQSYTKDSRFAVRMVKNIGSGVEEKVQELSVTLNEHRRAFLDHALITTEITAFQILNDVGNISAKVDGISTRLEWVSRQ